jgi:hypothetical protein
VGRVSCPGAVTVTDSEHSSSVAAWHTGRIVKGRQELLPGGGHEFSPLMGHRIRPTGFVGSDVAATSPRNAWAVGSIGPGPGINPGRGTKTLIEHWNGKTWKRVPSPNPPAATSTSSSAWPPRHPITPGRWAPPTTSTP